MAGVCIVCGRKSKKNSFKQKQKSTLTMQRDQTPARWEKWVEPVVSAVQ